MAVAKGQRFRLVLVGGQAGRAGVVVAMGVGTW